MDSSLFEAEFSLYFPSSLTWSHPEAPRPFLLRVEEVRALLHTSRLLLLLLLLPPPPWGQSRSGAPSNPSSLLEEVLLLLRGSAMVLSVQALGLVVLAAILLQTIAVAVSFMYFSRVLNTVSRWFERRRRARTLVRGAASSLTSTPSTSWGAERSTGGEQRGQELTSAEKSWPWRTDTNAPRLLHNVCLSERRSNEEVPVGQTVTRGNESTSRCWRRCHF